MKHPRPQKYLQEEMDIKYQLVPPHIHRRNAAERAIRTFKNHFIAGLSIHQPHTFHFIFGVAWSTSGGNLKHAMHLMPQSKTLGLQLSLWRT
jgi:hypothetical protein